MDPEDDQEHLEHLDTTLPFMAIATGVMVLFYGVGIYGVMKFNKCLVISSGVGFFVVATFNIVLAICFGASLAWFGARRIRPDPTPPLGGCNLDLDEMPSGERGIDRRSVSHFSVEFERRDLVSDPGDTNVENRVSILHVRQRNGVVHGETGGGAVVFARGKLDAIGCKRHSEHALVHHAQVSGVAPELAPAFGGERLVQFVELGKGALLLGQIDEARHFVGKNVQTPVFGCGNGKVSRYDW
eukprot:scaffold56737_cov75-Attheya_sp.AAC.2